MSSFNVGQVTAGGSTGAFSGMTGNQITLTQPGILQSVTIFWSGNAGINFFLGVYADSSNAPGALLATSALSTTNGGTQTLAMTTTPTLAPGKYWLVVQNQSNVNGHYDSGSGLGYFMGTPVWSSAGIQDPAPAGSTGAYTFSLYATFNTVVVLNFPMTIADTSTVAALGFHGAGAHFPVVVADTSTVSALGFHAGINQRFPLTVADTSTVAIGFHGAGTSFNVGPTSPGPSSGNYTGITASKITLAQRALLQSISVFWSVGGAGQSYLLGIYSDVAGAPGSLLASSALGTSVVGLNTLSFGAGPELAAGTYWLAVQVQSAISGYFDSTTGNGAFNNSQAWTGALPATFTVGGSGTFTFTLYATFTPSNAVHFPLVIRDTSTVSIGFHGAGQHFPLTIADTSTVTALGFHQSAQTPFTVGPTAPGSSTGAYQGLAATQVTMPQTGTLQSVSIFWFSDPGNNFILGVYADNAGAPGALLASSAVAVSTAGLQTLPMLTNPGLVAGTKYWLMVQTQSGIGGYFDTVGLGYFMGTPPWTGSLPSTAPTGSTGAFTFSLYASLTPGLPPIHFPLTVVDVSKVTALGFQGAPKRFSLVVADTSTVSALGFEQAAGFFTVGPTTPGSSTGSYQGLLATQVTVPQTGTLQSVTISWFSDPGNNYLLGVYTDNAGMPGTLIAQSAVTVSAVGAQEVPMLTHPGMNAGTKYWVTVQTQNAIGGYYDTGGLGAYFNTQPWTGTLPTTWGGGSTGAFTFSLYATLTPGAPPLRFPLLIADTSTVTALRFQGAPKRFPLTVADTSTVSIGFHGTQVVVTRFVKVGGLGGGTSWTDAGPLSIANSANPGDIIYLAGGSYPGYDFTTGGNAGNPIIIRRASATDPYCTAAPGWNSSFDSLVTFPGVILGAPYLTLDGNKWHAPGLPTQFGIKITTVNGDKAFDMQVGNTVARNVEVMGPGFNVVTTETDMIHFGPGSLITGCSLHDTDVGAFCWPSTNNCTIEYSFIYNIGSASTHPDIAYCGTGWTNGTFRYNVIANIVSEGVFFDSQGPGTNMRFYGNLWFQGNSRGGGCCPIEFQNGGTFGTVFLYHNTFVDWSKGNNLGGSTASVAAGSDFRNNLFVNSDSEWPAGAMSFNGFLGGYPSRGSNPIVGSSSPFVGPWVSGSGTPPATHVYADSDYATMPGYDPAQYVTNFYLSPGSWAAGQGTTVPPGMNTDMFGNTGNNLGAFQSPYAPSLHFPLTIADTSTVTVLAFHGAAKSFQITIADTSTVGIGFHVGRRVQLQINDTSSVTRLGWSYAVQHFPVTIWDNSWVIVLGYENDHYHQLLVVPPYSGITQPVYPDVNQDIAQRESGMEDGPRVIPPYAPTPAQLAASEQEGVDVVPPPISKTDLWAAMQTWPL